MASVRRILALISPRWRQPSTCEGCGTAFTCGASVGGCWCMKVELSAPARAQLRQRFSGCVCRACLDAAQQTSSPPATATGAER